MDISWAKPRTNDMRQAPSLEVIASLLVAGCRLPSATGGEGSARSLPGDKSGMQKWQSPDCHFCTK